MACTGMIFVEILVQALKCAVVGAVLGLAVEAFLVRTPVGLVDLVVESPVRPVIASVLTVVVIMREGSCGRCRYGQHRRRNESFADGHGVSPVELPDAQKPGMSAFRWQRTSVTLNPTGTPR